MNPFSAAILRPVATTLLAARRDLARSRGLHPDADRALPSVDRPTIGVWAGLPGASADTIATSLAQPLERQVGVIPGIIEMGSFSATGGTQITVQFELGRDIDAANAAVQAAINTATPKPAEGFAAAAGALEGEPVGLGRHRHRADLGRHRTRKTMYDYADSVHARKNCRQLPGVAKVECRRRRAPGWCASGCRRRLRPA